MVNGILVFGGVPVDARLSTFRKILLPSFLRVVSTSVTLRRPYDPLKTSQTEYPTTQHHTALKRNLSFATVRTPISPRSEVLIKGVSQRIFVFKRKQRQNTFRTSALKENVCCHKVTKVCENKWHNIVGPKLAHAELNVV